MKLNEQCSFFVLHNIHERPYYYVSFKKIYVTISGWLALTGSVLTRDRILFAPIYILKSSLLKKKVSIFLIRKISL